MVCHDCSGQGDLASWRIEHNSVGTQGSPGNITPHEYAAESLKVAEVRESKPRTLNPERPRTGVRSGGALDMSVLCCAGGESAAVWRGLL